MRKMEPRIKRKQKLLSVEEELKTVQEFLRSGPIVC